MFAFIGETLRRLRKERGKTLEQLGTDAKLGRGQLSRIENSRQEATLTTLTKILRSQGVDRREFFRRYDLVEAEAQAIEQAKANGLPAGGAVPAPAAGGWPMEVREALEKLEPFAQLAFQQARPTAQGAIEVGEYVILFRVVPRTVAAVASPPAAVEEPAPALAGKPAGRRRAAGRKGKR
jgi:transcriptional regulator with XRE-family HTH domain